MLDYAYILHELMPLNGTEKPKASYGITNRYLVGGLFLAFYVDKLIASDPVFRQALFHPGERKRQPGAHPHELSYHFRDEGTFHRRAGAGHVGNNQYEAFGIPFNGIFH